MAVRAHHVLRMIMERAGRPMLGSEIWDVVSKQFGKPQKIPELTARHRMKHQLSLLRDARYVCPSLTAICAPTPDLTAACASCTRPPTQLDARNARTTSLPGTSLPGVFARILQNLNAGMPRDAHRYAPCAQTRS